MLDVQLSQVPRFVDGYEGVDVWITVQTSHPNHRCHSNRRGAARASPLPVVVPPPPALEPPLAAAEPTLLAVDVRRKSELPR
jgi:hypothetical protein